jgi:hypothetical protein
MTRMISVASLAAMIAAAPADSKAQNYQQLATSAFARSDYAAARRNLRLAFSRAKTPEENVALRRKIAVTFVFEGDLDAARKEYSSVIETVLEAGLKRDAHDHYALAAISALEKDEEGIAKHIADAAGITPATPYAPMFHAIAWGHVGELERVAQARAQMEAAAAKMPKDTTAQQAAALARVIHAVLADDQQIAQRALTQIKTPSMRAFAHAFLANSIRREKNRTAASKLDAKVRSYKELNIYSAVAWRMIK